LLVSPIIGSPWLSGLLQSANIPSLIDIFWRFFVIGGTLFGSGYVIAAYLQRAFVDNLHWLTPQQLIDVLAIGQSTPGPVTSTSSAAGYIMTVTPGNLWSGIPGAIVATIAVFLPAFVVVLILGRVVPYMRRYSIIQDFLKGVNAGVIALLIMAFINLAFGTLVTPGGFDWLSLILTGLAFYASERLKWSPLRLMIVGAGIGLVRILAMTVLGLA
jgi:chromate transporter